MPFSYCALRELKDKSMESDPIDCPEPKLFRVCNGMLLRLFCLPINVTLTPNSIIFLKVRLNDLYITTPVAKNLP